MAHNFLGIHILLLLISRQHLILVVSTLLGLEATFCLPNYSVSIIWFANYFVHKIFIESSSYDAVVITRALCAGLRLVHTSILNSSSAITYGPNLFPIVFSQWIWNGGRIFSSQLISLLLALRLLIRSLVDSTHEQFGAVDVNLSVI